MDEPRMITITEQHLKLAKHLRFDWEDSVEFGAITTDCKRPFGNGDVNKDMSEILGLTRIENENGDVEEEPLTWEQCERLMIEMTAVVNRLIQYGASMAEDDLNGHGWSWSQPLPWRAQRTLQNMDNPKGPPRPNRLDAVGGYDRNGNGITVTFGRYVKLTPAQIDEFNDFLQGFIARVMP